MIVTVWRTVLSGARDRIVAEWLPVGSGSIARTWTVPSGATTTDQTSDPGRLRPTGQPATIRPSWPSARMLPPPEADFAVRRRYRTLPGPIAGAATLTTGSESP